MGQYAQQRIERNKANPTEVEKAFELLRSNLERRIRKFGWDKHVSPAESMGILLEECKELIDAHHSNNLDEYASELLDVGVTCIWGIISLLSLESQE